MTLEQITFIVILIVAMALYITQRLSVILVAVLTICALTLTGILDLAGAFAGFSSPATISIAAMFILSAGLIRTGALDSVVTQTAAWSQGKPIRLMLAMAVAVPITSAFMNNTPIVVMMVPIMMSLARQFSLTPSKLMMPLSFFAIMGGTCTLIGTSTNLLIDDIYSLKTDDHLSMFDFAPLGLILLATGIVYMLTVAQKLLPKRESLSALLPVSQRSNYVTEVIVQEDSPLVGEKVEDVFPKIGKLRFLQLQRGEDLHIGFKAKKVAIQVGDAVIVEGDPRNLTELIEGHRVELGTVIEDAARVPMRTFSLTMFELVVLPDSPYVGSRVRDLNLNRQYGVKVLAIQRSGRHHRMDIRRMRVKAGDMFLVQGDSKAIATLKESSELLVIEEVDSTIRRSHKARAALAIMLGVVLAATITPIPLVVSALVGVALMLLTRCLETDEIIHSLDVNVLFLLVGTIPLGLALESTGLSEMIIDGIFEVVGSSPFLTVAAVYLVTNVLTSLLSNTAVAVLMTPLAIELSARMGLADPKTLVMTVAYAASAAFATPISYQTNIIVMGPGGYLFKDFVKVGLPLSLLYWIIASIMIPILWPMN